MKFTQIIICLIILLLFPVTTGADLTVEKTAIITNDTKTWSPAWSPDGESIAYVAYDDSRNQQVYTINIDGSGKTQITNTTDITINRKWGVAWLDEGITYLSYDDVGGLQKIYVIRLDGTGTRKLLDDMTRQGKEEEDDPPIFAEVSENPVTGKILFTSYDVIDKEKIYEINIDGTGKKQVIDDDKRQWNPAWSPDGKFFVYMSYDDSNIIQLFTVNADGTGKKQITSDNVKKYDPNWGHDGILFVSFVDRFASGEKLYIMNPDGTDRKLAIEDSYKQKNPRWSADGTKVLYEDIDISGNKDIKVLYLQKSAVVQTPVTGVTPTATATVSGTPAEDGQIPPSIEDSGTERPVSEEEHAEESNLEEVLMTMFIILALIVLVMLAILLFSDLFSQK